MIALLLLLPFSGLDTLHLVSDFGEYRPLFRFHMGWDLSTGGRAGWPLVAGETLRVLRVRAGHWGYGRALYVVDPGGRRWVVAHLDRLHPALEDILEERQRARQRVAVDFWLSPPWTVVPGETLAWTGWTGNVDPHLHIELRDTAWRAVHPGSVLSYAGSGGAPRIRALRVIPLDPRSRVEGMGLIREFSPPFPDTLEVFGPFGLWVRVHVPAGRYVTTPQEVMVRVGEDTLFHVRMDTLDWGYLQEAAFLYVPEGRFFSDLWIRLYGWPPPPHHAYRRSPQFYRVTEPVPMEIRARHPLGETTLTFTVLPGKGKGRGRVVWDTLAGWRLQTHPWGVALWDGRSSDIFWIRDSTRVYTAEGTLEVRPTDPSREYRWEVGPHLRVVLPREGLLHAMFTVVGAEGIRPRSLPLRRPLEVQVDSPWVAGRWKKRWIPVRAVDRWWDLDLRRDEEAPVLIRCEVRKDRVRAYVQDDAAGWDPDSSEVRWEGKWWPFLAHPGRGWLDVLDVKDPRTLSFVLGDGLGRRRVTYCP